jgi:ATP-dependent Clp protease ATP-binding subunit ClpA
VFERFTQEARQVVVLAQDEARALRHDHIGTDHLLLGLLREGTVAELLSPCGVTLETTREEVRRRSGEGDGTPSGQIPFTPDAKKTLELSLREALDLQDDFIAPTHILLGLLSADPELLRERGVDEGLLREAGRPPPRRPAGLRRRSGRIRERFTERANAALDLAEREARGLNHDYVGTEHLLLGLLAEQEGLGARVLGALGVTLQEARTQVARIIAPGDEPVSDDLPLTPRTKKVLELALREALSLGHNYIGTEHILLGLVRENEGVAARILLDFDADAEKVHDEVIRMLSRPRPTFEAVRRPTRRAWEYRIVQGEATIELLGELGREGWERAAAQGGKLIFKRPRR